MGGRATRRWTRPGRIHDVEGLPATCGGLDQAGFFSVIFIQMSVGSIR